MVLSKLLYRLDLNVVINVEISMTMAVVGVGLFIYQSMNVGLIKMNAMIGFISFIVVGVMTFVGETGVNFSHDKLSD